MIENVFLFDNVMIEKMVYNNVFFSIRGECLKSKFYYNIF
jgi:hypothetical protein